MWKVVPDTDGMYEVAPDGRIRSKRTGRCLRPMLQGRKGNQYEVVLFCYGGVQRRAAVHRVVALVFLGPPPEGKPLVLHRDGDRRNNRRGNLRYGTQKDNMADIRRHSPEAFALSAAQTKEIRRRRKAGEQGRSLAKEFNVSEQYICDIHKGRR